MGHCDRSSYCENAEFKEFKECEEFEEFFKVTSRNVNRARVRLGSEQTRSLAGRTRRYAIRMGTRFRSPRATNFCGPFPVTHYWPTLPSLPWVQLGTRLETPSPRNAKRRVRPRILRIRKRPKQGAPREANGVICPLRSAIPSNFRKCSSLSLCPETNSAMPVRTRPVVGHRMRPSNL